MYSRRLILTGLTGLILAPRAALANVGFQNWLSGFKKRAARAVIKPATLKALNGAEYLSGVIKSDRKPAETAKPLEFYISSAAAPSRIKNGQAKLRKHKTLLGQLERKYGVPKGHGKQLWRFPRQDLHPLGFGHTGF